MIKRMFGALCFSFWTSFFLEQDRINTIRGSKATILYMVVDILIYKTKGIFINENIIIEKWSENGEVSLLMLSAVFFVLVYAKGIRGIAN